MRVYLFSDILPAYAGLIQDSPLIFFLIQITSSNNYCKKHKCCIWHRVRTFRDQSECWKDPRRRVVCYGIRRKRESLRRCYFLVPWHTNWQYQVLIVVNGLNSVPCLDIRHCDINRHHYSWVWELTFIQSFRFVYPVVITARFVRVF